MPDLPLGVTLIFTDFLQYGTPILQIAFNVIQFVVYVSVSLCVHALLFLCVFCVCLY